MAAFDNFDHTDRSSTSGMLNNHGRVLYYSKRNQKCCHQSQESQKFVFSNWSSQINFLVKNWDCAIVVRKNWFCQRHSLFRRKSLTSLVLTGTLMHWTLFWVPYVMTETWVMLMLWFRLEPDAGHFCLVRHCPYGKLDFCLIFPTRSQSMIPCSLLCTASLMQPISFSNIAFLSSAMKGFTALLQRFSWSNLNIFEI